MIDYLGTMLFSALAMMEPSPYSPSPDSDGFWDNRAIATPYRADISPEEKIAGLSRVWAEAKFNFSNFDHAPTLNWDSVYLANIPLVTQTKSTLEYWQVLQRMMAALKDSHTKVWPPPELYSHTLASPAIETDLVEGKVLITKVLSDSLKESGIKAGMEIVNIEGIPACHYADSLVIPYVSASSPQTLEALSYQYFLLRGDVARKVPLMLSNAKGDTIPVSLARCYTDARPEELEFKIVDSGIAYVNLTEFRTDSLEMAFDLVLPAIRSSKGLIIDLRHNAGGNTRAMRRLLGHLTESTFAITKQIDRGYSPMFRHWNKRQPWQTRLEKYEPINGKYFGGPLVVLAGPFTASASEDFLVAIRQMKRGTIIGEPTAGSSGQALHFLLPGGLLAVVEVEKVSYADGTEFDRIGIKPDVLVKPTVQDVRQRIDPALEAAVNMIRRQ